MALFRVQIDWAMVLRIGGFIEKNEGFGGIFDFHPSFFKEPADGHSSLAQRAHGLKGGLGDTNIMFDKKKIF